MPKAARYALIWCEERRGYEFYEQGKNTPALLPGDDTTWYGWLVVHSSFSFQGQHGRLNLLKEKRKGGEGYWYAYRSQGHRTVKKYAGRTAGLTITHLEQIAQEMNDYQKTAIETKRQRRDLSQGVLLIPKFHLPRVHSSLLVRERLFSLLDRGLEYPFTLLSAPAGSGKTTLVSQWITTRRLHQSFPPVAWVSLDTSDNDPMRFWSYFITACQIFQIDVREARDAFLEAIPQPPFVPSKLISVLTPLLNALTQRALDGILVLEDYHIITEHSVHETVAFFLEHLPANIHLMMLTRSDPPFPLARLRARHVLYEIRASDLHFSLGETTTLLRQALSSPLAPESIRHLHMHLEGWPAGLHMVKLALQRTTTQASGERTLTTLIRRNASLQEYFVTEVLDPQPELVQQFLLQTSVLSRLTASLCDTVTEQQDSQAILVLLERANLFLEALDTAGQWYRYHALFSEAMRSEARRRMGEDQLRQLSSRASSWYERHGFHVEAIDAALHAQDYARAAILIEQSLERQISLGKIHEYHTLYHWLEQFPETVLKRYPVLCLSYATTLLLMSASWKPSQLTLRELERLLRRAEQGFWAENNLLKLGELFAFRSLLAWRQDETQAAALYAKQALAWLPQTQQIWHGITLCAMGKEWIEAGHFQQACAALLEAQARCETAENPYFIRVTTILLARVFFEQGEFQQAFTLYRQALAEARKDAHIEALCYALTGMAALSYEWNELEAAYQQAQEVIALSQLPGLEVHAVHATLILARIQQARGHVTDAQLQLAARLDTVPAVLLHLAEAIQTAQARIALSVGDHMTLQRWATGRKPSHDFSQELEEELLLARWLRAQGKQEEASHQLERLLAATQNVGRTRRTLEIQVEMALVEASCNRKVEAQRLLRGALAQAFDRNAMRLFLDAGEQMAILLRSLLPQVHEQPFFAYVRALLNAFPVQQQRGTQAPASPLLDPLSPQETRVLRLLTMNYSNAEIARELVVSVNTIRTHVQSIYRKLGVHKRSAANEVARDLHLLS